MKIKLCVLLSLIMLFTTFQSSTVRAQEGEIINVSVPTTATLHIDPFELGGRGQVHSSLIPIVNVGNTDVLFCLEFSANFASGIELSPVPFESGIVETGKILYLEIDFGREDIAPIVLTDGLPNNFPIIIIPAGEVGLNITISGCVTKAVFEDWHEQDVDFRLAYKMRTLPKPTDIPINITNIPDDGIWPGYEYLTDPSTMIPLPTDDMTDTHWPTDDMTDTPWPTDDMTDTPWPMDDMTGSPWPTDDMTDTPWPTDDMTDTPWPTDDMTDTPWPTDDMTDTPWQTDDTTYTPWQTDDTTYTPWQTDDTTGTPWSTQ